jgi:hypothetical protein
LGIYALLLRHLENTSENEDWAAKVRFVPYFMRIKQVNKIYRMENKKAAVTGKMIPATAAFL